jgi:uncharacterized protein (DUF433 family)
MAISEPATSNIKVASTAMDGHIEIDDRGIARLAGSRSRVIDVVLDRRAYGWTPEEIREQHPHLSLAQIHAAFAYYYARQAELDADIERRFAEVEALRAAAGESPVAKRLRAEGKLA